MSQSQSSQSWEPTEILGVYEHRGSPTSELFLTPWFADFAEATAENYSIGSYVSLYLRRFYQRRLTRVIDYVMGLYQKLTNRK